MIVNNLIADKELFDFKNQLYNIHIEELSFLLEDYDNNIDVDGFSWMSIQENENRIISHLDALQVGFQIALKSLKNVIKYDNDDALSGAIYALSSLSTNDQDHHSYLISKFLVSDKEKHELYHQALKYSNNNLLAFNLLSRLVDCDSTQKSFVLNLLGYLGELDPLRIWPLFHDKDESVKTAAMVAVMRLGFKKAVPAMEQAVLENKELFNEHRLFPLLMLGSKKALEFSRRACQSASYIKPQYPIYLALGGNEQDITHILKALEFEEMNLAVLEALGIHGSLKSINTLMKFISSTDDEEKLTAAKSLNQISGAQLFETITVIEKEDEDIETEDITGKPAASGEEAQSGDERTIEIKQDCTDKERWAQWWQENKGRFDQSVRYRHGKPYSFYLCLEEIAHPDTNYEDRQRAYNEMVMRSGHHIPFEPDWFVDKQIDALKKWQTWWNENKTQFSNQWMFDGV